MFFKCSSQFWGKWSNLTSIFFRGGNHQRKDRPCILVRKNHAYLKSFEVPPDLLCKSWWGWWARFRVSKGWEIDGAIGHSLQEIVGHRKVREIGRSFGEMNCLFGWWHIFFQNVHPEIWGRWFPIGRLHIFQMGGEKPPTSYFTQHFPFDHVMVCCIRISRDLFMCHSPVLGFAIFCWGNFGSRPWRPRPNVFFEDCGIFPKMEGKFRFGCVFFEFAQSDDVFFQS